MVEREVEQIKTEDRRLDESGKVISYLVYIIYLLAAFSSSFSVIGWSRGWGFSVVGLPFLPLIVGFLIALIKKEHYSGSIYESHLGNQIKIFLYTLLWGIVFYLLCFVLIGFPLQFLLYIWFLYQVIVGLLALSEHKPRDFKAFG